MKDFREEDTDKLAAKREFCISKLSELAEVME